MSTYQQPPCTDCVESIKLEARSFRRFHNAIVEMLAAGRYNFCQHCGRRLTDTDKDELKQFARGAK